MNKDLQAYPKEKETIRNKSSNQNEKEKEERVIQDYHQIQETNSVLKEEEIPQNKGLVPGQSTSRAQTPSTQVNETQHKEELEYDYRKDGQEEIISLERKEEIFRRKGESEEEYLLDISKNDDIDSQNKDQGIFFDKDSHTSTNSNEDKEIRGKYYLSVGLGTSFRRNSDLNTVIEEDEYTGTKGSIPVTPDRNKSTNSQMELIQRDEKEENDQVSNQEGENERKPPSRNSYSDNEKNKKRQEEEREILVEGETGSAIIEDFEQSFGETGLNKDKFQEGNDSQRKALEEIIGGEVSSIVVEDPEQTLLDKSKPFTFGDELLVQRSHETTKRSEQILHVRTRSNSKETLEKLVQQVKKEDFLPTKDNIQVLQEQHKKQRPVQRELEEELSSQEHDRNIQPQKTHEEGWRIKKKDNKPEEISQENNVEVIDLAYEGGDRNSVIIKNYPGELSSRSRESEGITTFRPRNYEDQESHEENYRLSQGQETANFEYKGEDDCQNIEIVSSAVIQRLVSESKKRTLDQTPEKVRNQDRWEDEKAPESPFSYTYARDMSNGSNNHTPEKETGRITSVDSPIRRLIETANKKTGNIAGIMNDIDRIIENNTNNKNTYNSARGRPKNNLSPFSENMSSHIPFPSPSRFVSNVKQVQIQEIPLSDSFYYTGQSMRHRSLSYTPSPDFPQEGASHRSYNAPIKQEKGRNHSLSARINYSLDQNESMK